MRKLFLFFVFVLMLSLPVNAVTNSEIEDQIEAEVLSLGLGSFVPSPAAAFDIAVLGAYDLYLHNWGNGNPAASVTNISGGKHVDITIPNIDANIQLHKTCSFNIFTCNGLNNLYGDLHIDSISYHADMMITGGAVDILNQGGSVNGLSVSIDGVPGFVTDGILDYIKDDFS